MGHWAAMRVWVQAQGRVGHRSSSCTAGLRCGLRRKGGLGIGHREAMRVKVSVNKWTEVVDVVLSQGQQRRTS
jgi:hypothetical protein